MTEYEDETDVVDSASDEAWVEAAVGECEAALADHDLNEKSLALVGKFLWNKYRSRRAPRVDAGNRDDLVRECLSTFSTVTATLVAEKTGLTPAQARAGLESVGAVRIAKGLFTVASTEAAE